MLPKNDHNYYNMFPMNFPVMCCWRSIESKDNMTTDPVLNATSILSNDVQDPPSIGKSKEIMENHKEIIGTS